MPTDTKTRLGDVLVREGLISQAQLRRALEEQQTLGGRLGRHLVDLGFVVEEALLDVLCVQLKIPRIDLDAAGAIQDGVGRYARADLAEQWGFCPVSYDPQRGVMTIAVSDPEPQLLTDIEGFLGMRVEPRLAPAAAIDRGIQRIFHSDVYVPIKPMTGLQPARSEIPAAKGGVPRERPPAPAAAPPAALPQPVSGPAVYDAQIAAYQQHFQQLQLQQLQQMQLQAQAQQAALEALSQPVMPTAPASFHAPPLIPLEASGWHASRPRPASAAPAPALRAQPSLGPEGQPSLGELAAQVARLERTLAAQARALRSLVDVLVDRGLITKVEMARKQAGQ